jgi:hypothetical protein
MQAVLGRPRCQSPITDMARTLDEDSISELIGY